MELLTMTRSEIARLQTCQRLAAGILTQADAACQLSLTARQVRGCSPDNRREGPVGVCSRRVSPVPTRARRDWDGIRARAAALRGDAGVALDCREIARSCATGEYGCGNDYCEDDASAPVRFEKRSIGPTLLTRAG
jgi:hypothetical protein